jgi:para-nitrobenzyl esterase
VAYRSNWLLAVTIGLLLNTSLPAAAPLPVVTTSAGPVRGSTQGDGAVFKGIAYAAPPIGALRWKPPRPVNPWKEVKDASQFGPICPQPVDERRKGQPQSEDCLTINVATPKLANSANLPVLVMVHGGAYFVGSSRERFDDAARIYNARGIVVVSMNYRLGRLGFFAHPGLRAEAPGDMTGNYWLMDQIAALRWVKRNIASFGGDPAKVTILGCSAGGSSINALMAAPAARGLFARASAHSGGGINNATRPLERAESEGVAFAARAGVHGEGAEALAQLRALDPATIRAADPGAPNYGAIVDGRLLPEETAISFAQGRIARVPFIVGSTSNEASIFGLMGFDEGVLKRRFGIDMAEVRRIYDPDGRLVPAELLRQVQTDFIFTAGATALGRMAARWQPSYAYHFAYVPAAQRADMPGAPHCADQGYIFDDPKLTADPANARIARTIQDYWANFIKTGNPNGAGLPQWLQYKGADPSILMVADDIRPVADFRSAQLRYWHALWAKRTGQASIE